MHSSLYSSDGRKPLKIEKLKCIINYFRRVLKNVPQGIVSFERRCLQEQEVPDWESSEKKLCLVEVIDNGLIEKEGVGLLQVDFANRFVGGGVLGSGCVQEEIRFVLCPELIVSRLFTQKLLENEVLFIHGCEQFNNCTGYSNTFKWKSDFVDEMPFDEWQRRCTKIVAMDAYHFRYKERHIQYQKKYFVRELRKAYAGFMERRQTKPENKTAVATGNWGCGAYNGDPKFKFLIQLLAASESERNLVYFTFHNAELKNDILKVCNFLRTKDYTTGMLYSKMLEYNNFCFIDTFSVFDYILQT